MHTGRYIIFCSGHYIIMNSETTNFFFWLFQKKHQLQFTITPSFSERASRFGPEVVLTLPERYYGWDELGIKLASVFSASYSNYSNLLKSSLDNDLFHQFIFFILIVFLVLIPSVLFTCRKKRQKTSLNLKTLFSGLSSQILQSHTVKSRVLTHLI